MGRSDGWHLGHFIDPRAYDEDSNMPSYHFLLNQREPQLPRQVGLRDGDPCGEE